MKVLLASNSPRRRELLKKLIPVFDVFSPNADEEFIGNSPEETAIEIASRKLQASASFKDYDTVICADTVVYCENRYFNKPKDNKEAFEMLKFLSGKSHFVYTGVVLKIGDKNASFFDCSKVQFKTLTDGQIKNYIENNYVLDKAGAYAIQDGETVEKFTGSYDNIVGLPTEKLKIYLDG